MAQRPAISPLGKCNLRRTNMALVRVSEFSMLHSVVRDLYSTYKGTDLYSYAGGDGAPSPACTRIIFNPCLLHRFHTPVPRDSSSGSSPSKR
jgi:hypothetical protein